MIEMIALLDEVDEAAFAGLRGNLNGITDPELDWRPEDAGNSIRWIVGHLCWFEEWAHDALAREGRYLTDTGPAACPAGPLADMWERFDLARQRYRRRIATLGRNDLVERVSFFGREEVTLLDVLTTHTQHLAGHRFQIRYVRGAYSRLFGTRKSDFDPW